jgi:hypothetical protein
MEMIWYVPSFYGDVRLEKKEKSLTEVRWEKLTEAERVAMAALSKRAADRGWIPKTTTSPSSIVDALAAAKGMVVLDAPLEKVRGVLAKVLKPNRKLVEVVKFADGRMSDEVSAPGAVAGVTVSKPVLGCPAPDLAAADLRAREVLFAFLGEGQQLDFDRHNAFVSVGAATGHQYMVTSRRARRVLARHGGRQLYDLDEQRAFCVHDDEVPEAEEMLALHVMLQLPWGERYLRHQA